MTTQQAQKEKKLLAAWLKSGGSEDGYKAAGKAALDDYEGAKLDDAGVKLAAARMCIEKAKALLGAGRFALAVGELADDVARATTPVKNPTGLMISRLITEVGALPKSRHASPAPTADVAAPVAPAPGSFPGLASQQGELPLSMPPDQKTLVRASADMLRKEAQADPTRRNRKLLRKVETREAIITEPATMENGEIIYYSTSLVQASLPHKEPGKDVQVWSRSNGRKTLVIYAGRTGESDQELKSIGIPYGVLPRLVLYFLVNQATRTKERKIFLGDSVYSFMRSLGISDSKQNYRALHSQMRRLLGASFKLTTKLTDPARGLVGVRNQYLPPLAESDELWWEPKNTVKEEQSALFMSAIVLGEQFFREICSRGFPLDVRAIRALRQSSLALDLYSLLSYQNHMLLDAGRQEFIFPYKQLQIQLGANFARPIDFKVRLAAHLNTIEMFWRGNLAYELSPDGLVLKPSTLQIEDSR
jgi:hypothetical protein